MLLHLCFFYTEESPHRLHITKKRIESTKIPEMGKCSQKPLSDNFFQGSFFLIRPLFYDFSLYDSVYICLTKDWHLFVLPVHCFYFAKSIKNQNCEIEFLIISRHGNLLSAVHKHRFKARFSRRKKDPSGSFFGAEKEGFEPSRRLPDLHP